MEHVCEVNTAQRGFSGYQNELAALFDHDISGPFEQGMARTGRDGCKHAHAAWTDGHCIYAGRSTGHRRRPLPFTENTQMPACIGDRGEVCVQYSFDCKRFIGQSQFRFHCHDRSCRIGHDHVNFTVGDE